jgi:hypothetical protein
VARQRVAASNLAAELEKGKPVKARVVVAPETTLGAAPTTQAPAVVEIDRDEELQSLRVRVAASCFVVLNVRCLSST